MKDKLSRGSLFFLHLSKNETQGRREGFETRRGVERRNDEEGGRTTKTHNSGLGSGARAGTRRRAGLGTGLGADRGRARAGFDGRGGWRLGLWLGLVLVGGRMGAGTRAGGGFLRGSALLVALDRLPTLALGAFLPGAFLSVRTGTWARPGSGTGLVLSAPLSFLLALFALGAAASAAAAGLRAAAPPLFVLWLVSAVAALLLPFLLAAALGLLGLRTAPWAGARASAALTTAAALTRAAASGARLGTAATAAAGVRTSGTPGAWSVLDEPDLPAVDLRAIQLLQRPLHVRVQPELDHTLVPATLVGVGIGNLASLPHIILEVLPAATTWQVLHDQTVVSSSWRTIAVSSPTPIPPTFKVTRTRAVREGVVWIGRNQYANISYTLKSPNIKKWDKWKRGKWKDNETSYKKRGNKKS